MRETKLSHYSRRADELMLRGIEREAFIELSARGDSTLRCHGCGMHVERYEKNRLAHARFCEPLRRSVQPTPEGVPTVKTITLHFINHSKDGIVVHRAGCADVKKALVSFYCQADWQSEMPVGEDVAEFAAAEMNKSFGWHPALDEPAPWSASDIKVLPCAHTTKEKTTVKKSKPTAPKGTDVVRELVNQFNAEQKEQTVKKTTKPTTTKKDSKPATVTPIAPKPGVAAMKLEADYTEANKKQAAKAAADARQAELDAAKKDERTPHVSGLRNVVKEQKATKKAEAAAASAPPVNGFPTIVSLADLREHSIDPNYANLIGITAGLLNWDKRDGLKGALAHLEIEAAKSAANLKNLLREANAARELVVRARQQRERESKADRRAKAFGFKRAEAEPAKSASKPAATKVARSKASPNAKKGASPCAKCGRVNSHGQDCRNAAACKSRVKEAKEGARA